jgi:hypothetical protein
MKCQARFPLPQPNPPQEGGQTNAAQFHAKATIEAKGFLQLGKTNPRPLSYLIYSFVLLIQ